MSEVLLVLLVTSLSCALIGNLLVLRKLSMVSDAIGHSVLLGIVLAFFITHDVRSPYLLLGAGLFGVLTVFSIELLSSKGMIKKDDAVGVVFPFFFAIAVILITRYARNVHLDTDMVLMGEVILSPLNRSVFLGLSLPKAFIQMTVMLFVNLGFIFVFFKELKMSTFDEEYAKVSGFSSGFLFYGLMSLVSMTAVVAFDAVGAILVISFLITPGASAYLLTKDLKGTILLSLLLAAVNSLIGYYLSVALNVSMSGMSATVAGITFFLIFLFNSKGLITTLIKRSRKKRKLRRDLFLIHLANHYGEEDDRQELGVHSIAQHMNWKEQELNRITMKLMKEKLVYIDKTKNIYVLSEKGRHYFKQLREEYRF